MSINQPEKKRVLFCSEATFLNTGYATYTREILNYLHNTGKYELAELASYGQQGDPRAVGIPWKFYGVVPGEGAPEDQIRAYNSKGTNQFGEWIFEHVSLDFLQHATIDIRDFWALDFIERSPFRPFYKMALMPTVDAAPQARQWIATYQGADAIFTYSDWAGEVLKEQSGGKINYLGTAPPTANPAYQPVSNKAAHKKKFGIDPEYKIIGTVMRNQRRKLFPDLFCAFRKFLDQSEDKKFYLYCHTSYPDLGWDIPELLQQHDLASHVLFTYICQETKKPFISVFRGPVTQSPYTGKFGATLSNVKHGATSEELSDIINLFDLYVQYANCLLPGQPVLLSNGWKNIEDVKVGDTAYTHLGNWKKVLNTFKTPVKEKCLKFSVWGDYDTLSVTKEHPLLVFDAEAITTSSRPLRENIGDLLRKDKDLPTPKFVEAEDVKIGNLIAYKIDYTENHPQSIDLSSYLSEHYLIEDGGKSYRYKSSTVKHPLTIDMDEEFIKWVGLYVADGTSTINKSTGIISVCCNENEEDNIGLCERVLGRFGNTYIYHYNKRKAVDVGHTNKVLANYMKDNCKSKTEKQFPNWVNHLPIELQKTALSGLFMGDGYYLEEKNVSILATISRDLADQVKNMCRRIGLNYNVRIAKKSGNRKPQYRFEIRGNVIDGEFNTDRSNSRGFIHDGYYFYQVKNIEEFDYEGDVYNFEVEDDHSYQCKIGNTHNLCEGFGIGLVESSACGVPVMGTDYSAMESVIPKLGGFPIKPKAHYKELETGCLRAVPDNDLAAKMFKDFFDMPEDKRIELSKKHRENFEKHFSIENSGKQWEDYLDSFEAPPIQQTWASPPRIRIPEEKPKELPPNIQHQELARWLIAKVFCEPEKLNTFFEARLTRDLIYRTATGSTGGMYFNEHSAAFDGQNLHQDFNFDIAYDQMRQLCERRNGWEQRRVEVMKQRGLM